MQKNRDLFDEFPAVSAQEWKNKILKDLKGKPYESLIWETREKLKFEPFYQPENTPDFSFLHYQYPLQITNTNNSWYNGMVIHVTNEKEANEKALKRLSEGVNSLKFVIELEVDFSQLLKNIEHQYIQTIIQTNHITIAEKFLHYLKNISCSEADIILDIDFLDDYAQGKLKKSELNDYFDFIFQNKDVLNDFPLLKLISLRSNSAHYAGASATTEIAYLMTKIHFLFQQLEDKIPAETLAKLIYFHLPAGISYFKEIAKIEAFKILYFNFLNHRNTTFESSRPIVHSETSPLYHSRLDIYNNMLRNTTQTLAAVIAGANTVFTFPHDNVLNKSSDFSERIAKNISILLQEESYIHKVKNIADGNYYLKTLTRKISEKAWTSYHKAIEKDNWQRLIEENYWQSIIKKEFSQLIEQYKKQEKIMVGVNKYPNPNEQNTEIPDSPTTNHQTSFTPLVPTRIACHLFDDDKL